jgi:carbon storage regulator
MLVLTRRVNESIVIGNNIVITILEIQRDAIRIGIKAPHDVEINREEIFQLLADKLKDSAMVIESNQMESETSNLVDEQV